MPRQQKLRDEPRKVADLSPVQNSENAPWTMVSKKSQVPLQDERQPNGKAVSGRGRGRPPRSKM
jgi:hypothetical protein